VKIRVCFELKFIADKDEIYVIVETSDKHEK